MTADLQFFLIYPNLHAPPSRLKRQWNLKRLEEQGEREREFKNTDLNKKERERERVCEFKNRSEKDGIYFAYT